MPRKIITFAESLALPQQTMAMATDPEFKNFNIINSFNYQS